MLSCCRSMSVLALGLGLVSGCGGGDGGANRGADNLKAVKAEVVTPDPVAGHEVVIRTTIGATRPYENVSILYLLISKKDWDEGVAEPRVVIVGEYEDLTIAAVGAGEADYQNNAMIPAEARDEREWYLTPIIDPYESVDETDNEDNLLDEESWISLTIASDFTDRPDLAIEYVAVEETSITLNPDSDDDTLFESVQYEDPESGDLVTANAGFDYPDWFATAVITATGAQGVDTFVYADIWVECDGQDIFDAPLLVFDWETEQYEWELERTFTPGEDNLIDLALLIPGENHRDEVGDIYDDISGLNIRQSVGEALAFDGDDSCDVYIIVAVDRDEELNEYDAGNLPEESDDELAGNAEDDSEYWVEVDVIPEEDIFRVCGVGTCKTVSFDRDECLSLVEVGFCSVGYCDLTYDEKVVFSHAIFCGVAAFCSSTGDSCYAPQDCPAYEMNPDPETCQPDSNSGGGTGGSGGGGSTGGCDGIDVGDKINPQFGVQGVAQVGLSAGAGAKLNDEGVSADVNVKIPFDLFGFKANLFAFSLHAGAKPQQAAEFSETLTFLDKVEYMNPGALGFEQTVERTAIMKTFKAQKGFFGVTLEGSATAAFGVRGQASVDPANFVVKGGPTGKIELVGSAGLDVGVGDVRVEGTVTLVEDYFYGQTAARLTTPGSGQLQGTLKLSIINELKGPVGKVELVSTATPCLGIDSFFGVKLCPTPEDRRTILGPYSAVKMTPTVVWNGPEASWTSCPQ